LTPLDASETPLGAIAGENICLWLVYGCSTSERFLMVQISSFQAFEGGEKLHFYWELTQSRFRQVPMCCRFDRVIPAFLQNTQIAPETAQCKKCS
jgi:hypothetical protein